jgi:hypothetical protein
MVIHLRQVSGARIVIIKLTSVRESGVAAMQ